MSKESFYQNILLPLEFSKEVEKRVDEAVRLMKLSKGVLTLLHVVDLVPLWGHGIEEEYQFRKDRFEKSVRGIKTRFESNGVKVNVVVTTGKPADEICKYAASEDVDIVLVSPNGTQSVFGWVLGSVAAKVTRHSPKPVLVIRRRNGNFVPSVGVQSTGQFSAGNQVSSPGNWHKAGGNL
jgi:nucleotide-binding universal stress UspA family protein